MAVRLFVGNLAYDATEAELREYFSTVGQPARVTVPVDRETGRPRGFAFVEYLDRAIAEEAIRRLNSQAFKGRPLAVSEARPREEGAPRPAGGGFGPRPPRPMDVGGPPATGTGRPERHFGPPAPARRAHGPAKRQQQKERGPKGPIRERVTGRFYSVDGDEDIPDDIKDESLDFENFATTPAEDEDEKQE